MLSWVRSSLSRRARKKDRQEARRKHRRRLRLEELEQRLAPATRVLGGLELSGDGAFTVAPVAGGTQVSAAGPVQVGLAPPSGGAFTPLLRLDGGVQFLEEDATGTFSTTGSVEAVVGGHSFNLLDGGAHTFRAGDLLGGLGPLAGGKDFTVGGADFTFSSLQLTDHGVALQGSLALPKLDGLRVAVTGNDHVLLDDSGAHLTGLDVGVSDASFTTAGLAFTAKDLHVHYSAATAGSGDRFTLSGDGSTSIAGKTVDVSFGTPEASGIVLDNGHLEGFHAAVTTPTLSVGGLTFGSSSLELSYDAPTAGKPEEFTLTGSTSVTFGASASLPAQSVAVQLGDSTLHTTGLVLEGGALSSLDLAVTGDVKVAGLDLHADGLRATFDAGSQAVTVTGAADFDLRGNKVNLQLGDQAEGSKGLVIQGGALQSFDAAVTGDVKVAGLDLHTDGLRATYDAGTQTVTVTGAADFDLRGNKVNLQLGDQAEGSKGLVIQGGALQSFDAAVTSDITVASLHVHTEGLRVTYAAAGAANGNVETITVSGKGNFALAGNTVEVQFGNDGRTQGLVLQNGQLTNLDASVSADFKLLGLTVRATKLTVAYAAATPSSPEMVEVYGQLSVSAGSAFNLGADLGTAANPGLELVNGQLAQLNLGVTGSFNLFGVTVAANGLTIQYDSTSHLLNIEGGATVSLGGLISGGVTLPNGGLTIDTATGALQVHGLDFRLSADFGAFAIHDLDVKYTTGAGGTSVALSGSVEIAHEFTVGGSFAISNGQLTDVALSYDATGGTGIAVGDTGAFITHIDGGIHHLNDLSKLSVDVGLGVTYGPTVSVLGHPYSLASVTGHLTVSASELVLNGNVQVLGGLYGTGTGTLTLDWGHGSYSLALDVGLYDHTIEVKGSIAILKSGELRLSAGASLNLPHTLASFLGNQTFASANLTLDLTPQNISQSFADIQVSLPASVGSLDLRYDFTNHVRLDGHFHLLGSTAELVGYLNPDGSFDITGALNINVAGNSVVAHTEANKDGFHATGNLNVLGQTASFRGDVYSNGTFDLTGTLHINAAGNRFDATFDANNNGLSASANLYVLGQTVYVHGSIASNGTFDFGGSIWINAAGIGFWAQFDASNSGFNASADLKFLGANVHVAGHVSSDGSFSFGGWFNVNWWGISFGASVRVDNGGAHLDGWVNTWLGSIEVWGNIYWDGSFSVGTRWWNWNIQLSSWSGLQIWWSW
jgi:hypothetical protein